MARLKKKQLNAILDIVGRWAHTMAGTNPFDAERVKTILDPVYQSTKVQRRISVTKGRGKKKSTTYKWMRRTLPAPTYICLQSPLALRIAAAVIRGRLSKKDAVVVARAFGMSPDFIAPLRRDKMLRLGGYRTWRRDNSPLYDSWRETIMPHLKAAQLAVFYPPKTPEDETRQQNNNKDEHALAQKLKPAIAARNLPTQSGDETSYKLEHNDMVGISGTSHRRSGWGRSAESLQFGNFYCNNSLDSAISHFGNVPWTSTCSDAMFSRVYETDLDCIHSTTLLDAELMFNALGITDPKHTWKVELMHAVPLCMTFESTVLLCGTRPVIKRNENGEMHCADGAAVSWPDGSGQYYLDGHALGNLGHKIVQRPDLLTIDDINAEPNEEIKRLAIEKYGWGKYLDQIGATVVDRRENWVDNTIEALVSIRRPIQQQRWDHYERRNKIETTYLEQRKLILACRSTGRQYFLAVPEDTESCEAGQRWMAEGANTHALAALSLPVRLVGAS